MDDQLITDVDNWLSVQPKKTDNYCWTEDASSSWQKPAS